MKKLSFVILLLLSIGYTACITGKSKSQGTDTNMTTPKTVAANNNMPRKMTQAEAEEEARKNPEQYQMLQQQTNTLNKKDLRKKKLPEGYWETGPIIPLKDTIR
jgi:tRNA G37 N-methylase Trm5